QLGERTRTLLAAVDATFLAVRGTDGHVVSRADLYLRDGVAQVEEVATEPAARGRGLASALVVEAVRRARSAGAELVFLVAEADDWPEKLYRRLGFSDVGRITSYTR
ncbi:MAG: GNAT family N-acetyltransferase, partial [Actinomycetota bacterium]|nr:GNAT family N-acetyltransferase [Actinomycetota bacterium]